MLVCFVRLCVSETAGLPVIPPLHRVKSSHLAVYKLYILDIVLFVSLLIKCPVNKLCLIFVLMSG